MTPCTDEKAGQSGYSFSPSRGRMKENTGMCEVRGKSVREGGLKVKRGNLHLGHRRARLREQHGDKRVWDARGSRRGRLRAWHAC